MDSNSFVFGVLDKFRMDDGTDIIVVGKVNGVIEKGMAVMIRNYGDDDAAENVVKITAVEIQQRSEEMAENCFAALRIECGQMMKIKTGTVLYTSDVEESRIHDTYVSAIGDYFVGKKRLELSDEDLRDMSITDCAEAWRIFGMVCAQNRDESRKEEDLKKRRRVAEALCKKILSSDEVFCIYNNKTDNPHMFSQTIDRNDDTYMCTPPEILLIPKACEKLYSRLYQGDAFTVRKIENGNDGEGIRSFLADVFASNGVRGVRVLTDKTSIDAEMFVPDISKDDANPSLEQWILLIGQMNEPETTDEKIIFNLYYHFLSRELVKARLYMPVSGESEKEVLFSTVAGRNNRQAVHMFTDVKRLNKACGEGQRYIVQPVSAMIEIFDCIINPSEKPAAGCYISREAYEEMNK